MVAVELEAGAPAGKTIRISPTWLALHASMLISVSTIGFLIARLPVADPTLLVGVFALSLTPTLGVMLFLGATRQAPPLQTIGGFSIVVFAAAVALIGASRLYAIAFDPLHALALLAVTHVPPITLVWIASRFPHESGRPALPTGALGGLSIALLMGISALAIVGARFPAFAVRPEAVCLLYFLALAPAVLGNWLQARREKRIPATKSDKPPNHISGIGAGGLLAFMVVVVALGVWAAATGTTAMIDTAAGIVVIFALAVAFVLLAISPFLPESRTAGSILKILRRVSQPLGSLASWIDSLLVFPVAGALGASQTSMYARYALLIGNIVPCAILGWQLPAPFGLLPLGAAVIGTVAIARRWAWIEEDRENAMLNRKFEGEHLRVGFGQDLRDETLIAFMTLLFLVPLALRQLYFALGPETFQISQPSDANDLLAWFSFFGTELAKGLPFVDWAEVYHVEGNAPIHLDPDHLTAGNHVIFASRVLVDLVLLAAFLQAISVAQRSAKLNEMFEAGTLDQLDPFSEPGALRKLVRRSENGLEIVPETCDAFPRYNEDRLEYLKDRYAADDELGFVARHLLDLYAQGGPEDQLVDQSKRPKPDRDRCDELLDELKRAVDVRIGPLKAAHYNLNSKSSLWAVRLAIVEIIAQTVDDPASINALSEILIGPGPGVADQRQEVRFSALAGLYRPALHGNPVAISTVKRARTDVATRVREEAERIWNELPIEQRER